jgi:hypothetical protein
MSSIDNSDNNSISESSDNDDVSTSNGFDFSKSPDVAQPPSASSAVDEFPEDEEGTYEIPGGQAEQQLQHWLEDILSEVFILITTISLKILLGWCVLVSGFLYCFS